MYRGIVACANANEEHSNGSQFFITLGPTESLQKKNTIFGRIGGETIYNVMEFNNLEVDSQDR
jgi:peptidyl-prolyl cis-trans isomerase SDCCAG10